MLSSFLLAALLQSSIPAATTYVGSTREVLAPVNVVPVRALRPMALSAEVGFNGLSGIGLQLGYNFHPHFAVDVGGGLSTQTGKVGVRGRYNLLTSDVTPFVGVGAGYGFGTPRALTNTDRGNEISFKIDRSPYAQGVAGVSYVSRNGLSLMASAGWTQLLRSSNILVKEGVANDRQKKALKYLSGSGPSFALAAGYAF